MKVFTLSIYFFALLGLNLLAGAAVPDQEDTVPFISSAVSNHIIFFSGKNWDNVLKTKGKALENAVIYDVMKQVHRKYSFDTSVTVHSINTKGLIVNVSVHQRVLPGASDARLQHVWLPDEVNSMIAQGKFTTMKELYVGDDRPALIAVQVPDLQADINECGSSCQRVFVVSVVVVGLMAVTLLVVLLWIIYLYCCLRRYPKESPPPKPTKSESSNSGESCQRRGKYAAG